MLKKFVAPIAMALMFALAPLSGAHADGYTPKIPTTTQITVLSNAAGKPVELAVSASANYPTPPAGNIAVTLSAAGTAARGARVLAMKAVFSTTVHFVDKAVVVTGPALPEGKYVATAALTPDNQNLFLPSNNLTFTFRVGAEEVGGKVAHPAAGSGLPNTGGPDLIWLLLGSGLVTAGAAGVMLSRRGLPAAV